MQPQPEPGVHLQSAPHLHAPAAGAAAEPQQEPEPQHDPCLPAQAPESQHAPDAALAATPPLHPQPVPGVHLQSAPQAQVGAAAAAGASLGQVQLGPQPHAAPHVQLQD